MPAGTEMMGLTHFICQKHWTVALSQQNQHPPKKKKKKGTLHVNVNWCFICTKGGKLLCCDQCPSSFHTECLKMTPTMDAERADAPYICEECESGR